VLFDFGAHPESGIFNRIFTIVVRNSYKNFVSSCINYHYLWRFALLTGAPLLSRKVFMCQIHTLI